MPEDENFYKDIIDNLYDGVYFVDRDRAITYWNKGAERITGYSCRHVIGRHCHDNMLNHVTANGVPLCKNQCPLAAVMEDGNPREADVFVHHADGHRIPILVRATPLRDAQGNIIGAVETFSRDRGERAIRRELQELRHSLQTDPLTGISNRQALEWRLRGLIVEYDHRADTGVGLLFMDIDQFKTVNDTYGHEIGDKALRMVAATLQLNVRGSDIIGRWGGEEFLAILYDISSEDALSGIAEKLRMLVECSRLDFNESHLSVTISIGATRLLPGDTPETLIRRADELMYQSKTAGRNRVSVG